MTRKSGFVAILSHFFLFCNFAASLSSSMDPDMCAVDALLWPAAQRGDCAQVCRALSDCAQVYRSDGGIRWAPVDAALAIAIENDHVAVVDAVLKYIHICDPARSWHLPIMIAMKAGHVSVVKFLLSDLVVRQRVFVQEFNASDVSPLMQGVACGSCEAVKLLLDTFYDCARELVLRPLRKWNGMPLRGMEHIYPLYCAVGRNDTRMVKILLDVLPQGAALRRKCYLMCKSALYLAVARGNRAAEKILRHRLKGAAHRASKRACHPLSK